MLRGGVDAIRVGVPHPRIPPTPRQYPTSILPAPHLHPASTRPASHLHPTCIPPASHPHPTCIPPAPRQYPTHNALPLAGITPLCGSILFSAMELGMGQKPRLLPRKALPRDFTELKDDDDL